MTTFTANEVLGNVTDPYVFQLGTTSAEDIDVSLAVGPIVYPNPARNRVFVAFPAVVGEAYSVYIHDVLGKRVGEITGEAFARENTVEWETGSVPNGIYLITVERAGDRKTVKVQVQH